jgi:hypothetical protein
VPRAPVPPPPHAARRLIRLLRIWTVCLCPVTAGCLVLAARRLGDGGRGDKGSCGGRQFEATEIATMDDEMLMEKMLNNTGWTSTRVLHTDALNMFLLMYGSTARYSSAPST